MRAMVKLAIVTLRNHWKVVLLMILFFSVTVMTYLMLGAYRDTARHLFRTVNQEYLIIHETDTEAEFYGSRIPQEIGAQLLALGYKQAIPVVHSATGTVGRDFQFIMGVDLSQYRDVEKFNMLAGRALAVNEPLRNTMIGKNFAERDDIQVGDTVSLRGRNFDVVGIFETRSFFDNDAWIPIKSAQDLLGWGTDVSYYVITDDGLLKVGDVIAKNTIVSRRGETVKYATEEMYKTIDMFTLIVNFGGLAAIFALGNVIFRMARIQQYQLAILRSVGYSRMHVSLAILLQAGLIFMPGFLFGLILAFIFPIFFHITLFDVTIEPEFSVVNIFSAFLILGGIALASVLITLIWAYRTNLSSLLRAE